MSIEGEALSFKSKVLRREVLQCEHLTAGGVCVSTSRQLESRAVMVFSTLAMLPPLVIFLFAQRYVISGLTAGAVKQ